jgi:hypothetical protein
MWYSAGVAEEIFITAMWLFTGAVIWISEILAGHGSRIYSQTLQVTAKNDPNSIYIFKLQFRLSKNIVVMN